MFKSFAMAATAAVLGVGLAASAGAATGRIDITVPSGPGGGWDQTGRAVQQSLRAARISSNVQVLNVPGAGGTIGLAQFKTTRKGNPNAMLVGGFTLISSVITNKSAVSLSDVTPIARLTAEYEIIVVPSASPLRTLGDLVARLKANPGAVSWAGGSAGSTDHVLAALVADAVGVGGAKVNYVPHAGGGEAMTSILGGHVSVGVGGWNEYEAQIKDGKLRALGIAAPQRVPGINVPTFREQGVNVELANWRGLFAPPGLNQKQISALGEAVAKMARSPEWKKYRQERGWLDYYQPKAEFDQFIVQQQATMKKTLGSLGMTR